jgi:glycosyltransferase involved in cell wall biosynthesis
MKLFEGYDSCIALLKPDDWACFLDGDILFFENNFGHQIREYIEKYPDTGLFTCYNSRSAYSFMVPPGTDQESDSIRYHRKVSADLYSKYHLQVIDINDHISGALICMKKRIWDIIRPELIRVTDGANLLGVDTQISNLVRGHGFKIRLMRGIYLLHYYRLQEGRHNKSHLMDQTINMLIRTSHREQQFKRCLESVRGQTYNNINILVSTDDDMTAKYVEKCGILPVKVKKRIKTEIETSPWNAYLNDLIAQVKGGWIFILDDDDYLIDKDVLTNLVKYLADDNSIYFFRMRWPNGRVIPSDQNFQARQAVRKDIGMPCFTFHAKHKHKIAFKPMKQGDYDYISRLMTVIKKYHWLNLIVTQTGNTGLNGKPEG